MKLDVHAEITLAIKKKNLDVDNHTMIIIRVKKMKKAELIPCNNDAVEYLLDAPLSGLETSLKGVT
jgi:hypothetical protein